MEASKCEFSAWRFVKHRTLITGIWLIAALGVRGEVLEDYVRKPDPEYRWTGVGTSSVENVTITRVKLTSQRWREYVWEHDLQIVRPSRLLHPQTAFLFISGDGDGQKQLPILRAVAERAGAIAAVVTRVPNQPLCGGRREDALIAYTFSQFLESGDRNWPLLFPMVKSAVRAMDAIQAWGLSQEVKVQGFVVAGASKRGWTTWLTGAADPRVEGIAPMVIDMLNLSAQVRWSEKVYGAQSEQIHDYTEQNLIARMNEPEMAHLRGWVDPYSYRARYTMPKLLLLGTNDRYWTVDSLRHYWRDLPEPKLVFQTPNAGHDLAGGKEALQTLAAFFELVAGRQALPALRWEMGDLPNGKAQLQLRSDHRAQSARFWTAQSSDRDFRNDQWTSHPLPLNRGKSGGGTTLATPSQGYEAYLGELVLLSPSGHPYRVSTEARVTPDTTP